MPARNKRGPDGRFAKRPRHATQEQLPVIADVPRTLTPPWAYVRAILAIRAAPLHLPALRNLYHQSGQPDRLLRILRDNFDIEVEHCYHCDQLHWTDDTTDIGGNVVCDNCRYDNYSYCDNCEDWGDSDDFVSLAGDGSVCERCANRYYTACYECADYVHNDNVNWVDDDPFCTGCYEELPYCDDHDVVYRGDRCPECAEDEPEQTGPFRRNDRNCPCVAERPDFLFPIAGGKEKVRSDRRFPIEVPEGQLTFEGMRRIRQTIYSEILDSQATYPTTYYSDARKFYYDLFPAITDWSWVTADGTLPKRLSKLVYKECHKLKLSAKTLEAIGTIAKANTPGAMKLFGEFTRDLSGPPADYGNAGSCWWSQFTQSRCTLKSIGGLVLRTYTEDNKLTGRVFIVPINKDYESTHDTILAAGYLVFNAYGNDLMEQRAAQLLATFTGFQQKSIYIEHCEDRSDRLTGYGELGINGNKGYIVAPQAVLDAAPNTVYPMGQEFPEQAMHGVAPVSATTVAA